MELERFEKGGGVKMISPEEGITFLYKGEFIKLTGQFASQKSNYRYVIQSNHQIKF